MTATQRATWLAVAVLTATGIGAHAVDRHRPAPPSRDLFLHDGWREVAVAVSRHLWIANLALLLAVAGIVLLVRGRNGVHSLAAIAMRGIVVAAALAFPVALPGAARALQRRLARRAPRR